MPTYTATVGPEGSDTKRPPLVQCTIAHHPSYFAVTFDEFWESPLGRSKSQITVSAMGRTYHEAVDRLLHRANLAGLRIHLAIQALSAAEEIAASVEAEKLL